MDGARVRSIPAHLRGPIAAMVEWLAARAGVLDRVEFAPHTDGAWLGHVFVIIPDPLELDS